MVIPCGFYCVASDEHFVGLVALLNSLRLTGNDAPLFVTDCGLTARQRERLAPHVVLVEVEDQRSPHLAKWAGPLAHRAEVSVLLDVDIIVLRSLDPLVAVAQHRPLVFADPLWHRFDENWGRLLGLSPLRRGTYFNAGVIALPARRTTELLPIVATAQQRIDTDKTWLYRRRFGIRVPLRRPGCLERGVRSAAGTERTARLRAAPRCASALPATPPP